MGTIALGALAGTKKPAPEDRKEATPRKSSLKQSVPTPEDLPATLPASSVSRPTTTASPSRGSIKAQSIFQSLLLAPNNQNVDYDADGAGPGFVNTKNSKDDTQGALPTPPISNPSMSPPQSRKVTLDTTSFSDISASSSPQTTSSSINPYFASTGLTTPTTASTPGYTPTTPMTPATPQLQCSSENIVKGGKSVTFALHDSYAPSPIPSNESCVDEEDGVSNSCSVSELQEALEKLTGVRGVEYPSLFQ